MKVSIGKSDIQERGVSAPSSKSYTIRALICAALAAGESKIVCPLKSDDTDAASDVLGRIGIRVVPGEDRWLLTGGDWPAPNSDLDCRESAATLRFMTALAAAIPAECRLKADPSLAL